jgi:hypothetical protein
MGRSIGHGARVRLVEPFGFVPPKQGGAEPVALFRQNASAVMEAQRQADVG